MKQHPIFSRLYDPFMALAERTGLGKQRRWLVGRAEGQTLEVGIGTGRNLCYFKGEGPYVGLDPEVGMLNRARRRTRKDGGRVALVRGVAEQLPFKDEAFQSVVSCVTFCSVSEPRLAGQEVKRVLKPGGKLLFLEHIRSGHLLKAWFQEQITPLTRRFNANCHHNRQTLETFRQAGLTVDEEPVKGDVLVRGMAENAERSDQWASH